MIIAYRRAVRAVFLHGFAKSAKDDLGEGELRVLKMAASVVLEMNDDAIGAARDTGKWIEVICDGETV